MLGIFSHLCLAKKKNGEQPLAGSADLLLPSQPVDPPYLSGLVKGELQGIACGECAEQCCSSPATHFTHTHLMPVSPALRRCQRLKSQSCQRKLMVAVTEQPSSQQFPGRALRTALEALHSVEAAENSMETVILLEWKLGTKHILSQMNQVQPNVPSNSVDLHGNQRNSLLLGE